MHCGGAANWLRVLMTRHHVRATTVGKHLERNSVKDHTIWLYSVLV
jgi:hypothetical protein